MNKHIKQTTAFLAEVKTEVKKVSWPSRKETIGGTVVVLIAVLIAASFLGIVDISLSKIVKALIQY